MTTRPIAPLRTRIGIVGAGPAGLMLAQLLQLAGIESIIIETRGRAYIENRVRAGVLESWVADLLIETGIGARLQREAMVHDGVEFAVRGERRRIDFKELVGKSIWVYGQQELVKDLVAARLDQGKPICFEASEVALEGLDSDRPRIGFVHERRRQAIECDFIAGCDGFHGVSRPSAPAGAFTCYEQDYPFAWLGILAESRPVSEELIYSRHANGFALYSMRAPELSRLYLQCQPGEDLAKWPDARVWEELRTRLGETGGDLVEGKVLLKNITPMRSFVTEPMQYRRLFLAGDSAHIVPPTGAKGMNLAIADVVVLSRALEAFYGKGRTDLLEGYSAACLRRVWMAERFSWWMTMLLHRHPGSSAFEERIQFADIEFLTSSRAACTALAENYVGLPMG